jgi:hypothetical protein
VPQIFKTVLIAVVVLFIMSGSLVAQAKLPFVGTRTFCFGGDIGGDDRTRAIVTITATGVTTLKTNAYNSASWGGDSPTYRYENFSGKMDRKGVVYREPRVPLLEVRSGTAIRIFTEQDWMDGTLCTSSDAPPKEITPVKPAVVPPAKQLSTLPRKLVPAAKPASTQTYSCVPFQEVKEKDYKRFVEIHPFLTMDDLPMPSDSEPKQDWELTKFYFADLQEKGMPRLFFLENPQDCGNALGCSLSIEMDQGEGFKDVSEDLNYTGFGDGWDIHISQDHLSLIVDQIYSPRRNSPGSERRMGKFEYRLRNNQFKPIPTVPGKLLVKNLPKCSERPIWNPAAKSITTGANANSLSNSMSSNEQKLVAGSWRDENSLTTLNVDGTAISKFDSGDTAKGTWSIDGDFLTIVWVEGNGKRLEKPQQTDYRILELTREKFVSKGPDGKEWHAIRVK